VSEPTLSLPGQLLAVLRKDLLVEWRGRARAVGVVIYALILLLLLSFAIGPDSAALKAHAAGYIWLTVLTASTLLLTQSFTNEVEGGALEALLLLPTHPVALYYGKALANFGVLVGLSVATVGFGVVLCDLSLVGSPFLLLAVLALGCGGLAAPGTLYAGLTVRTGAQQLMLPLLMFPLVVPALLAAVKATQLCFETDAMGQLNSWLGVLIAFNAVYWSLCGVLFTKVVDE
jgi:heme exporter protein B